MAKVRKKCEVCGTGIGRTERFCRFHRLKELERLERAGYLEPLKYRTQEGVTHLSEQRFLTLDRKGRYVSLKSSSELHRKRLPPPTRIVTRA